MVSQTQPKPPYRKPQGSKNIGSTMLEEAEDRAKNEPSKNVHGRILCIDSTNLKGRFMSEPIETNETSSKQAGAPAPSQTTASQANASAPQQPGSQQPVTAQPSTAQPSAQQAGKPKRTFKDYALKGVVSTCVIALAFLGIGEFISVIGLVVLQLTTKPLMTDLFGAKGAETFYAYFSFIFLWILPLVLFAAIRPWRGYLKALWTKPSGNTPKMLILGVAVGLLMNALCIGIAVAAGNIPSFELVAIQPLQIIIMFIAVFIQSSLEEMLMRGFVYQRTLKMYGPVLAIAVNCILFACIHLSNDGITPLAFVSIASSGLLFSLAVYYLDSIWMAFGIHTGWNFCQGILFGLPNSGNAAGYAIFQPAGQITGGIAWDPIFGVEGTIVSIVVLLIASGLIVLWGKKHPRKHFDITQD